MKIILNQIDIMKIKNLIALCPDTFTYVPLKLYKDENGSSFASISMLSLNGDIVFSGKTQIEDLDFEPLTGMMIRLPISKSIVSNIFSEKFDRVEIDKTKILVKDKKKKLSLALFELDENEITDFPFTNLDIIDLVNEKNNVNIDNEAINYVTLDSEIIKDFNSCFNILSNPENVMVLSIDNEVKFKSEDYTGNCFEYTLVGKSGNSSFESKYDMNLIKVLISLSKFKNYSFDVIFNPLITAITIENEELLVTIAVTALKE